MSTSELNSSEIDWHINASKIVATPNKSLVLETEGNVVQFKKNNQICAIIDDVCHFENIPTYKDNASNLPQQLAIKSDVDNIITEVNTVKTDVDNIITEVNTVKTDVDNVKTDFNTVKSDVDNIIIEVDNVKTEVNTVKSDVDNVKTEIINSNTDLSFIQQALGPIINPNMFLNSRKSVVSILTFFNFNQLYYNGTGWFYYENEADLVYGYIITAAHLVIIPTKDASGNVLSVNKLTELSFINPINNNLVYIDPSNVYIDGLFDIALIKTNINLSQHKEYCLKLSETNSVRGELCFVIGNPLGIIDDSITMGTVRNSKYYSTYSDKNYVGETILISAPAATGISGSPILNSKLEVIGIICFATGTYETFLGGPSLNVLKKTLSVLKTHTDYKLKRYLGIEWVTPNLFEYKLFNPNYTTQPINAIGVYINRANIGSPFSSLLGTLILSATISETNEEVKFGSFQEDDKSPGYFVQFDTTITLAVKYKKIYNTDNAIYTTNVILNKSYNDVNSIYDINLEGAAKNEVKSNGFLISNL